MQAQEIAAGTTFGPYAIEGLIAGGGMGAVYAARHVIYGSPVALKILHADLHRDASWRQRFNEEGLVGVQLKHPHILSARELIMEDERVALVLDLVQSGKTLLKVMSREFPSGLPVIQALKVWLGLIQGVDYAHDKGVVHGDIKPENVLIHGEFRDASTWVPKLTDFGTVGIIAHPVLIDGQPAVVVSPRYASPEHVQGMDHLEERSDIYCLGLLLHYLLTGQHASNASSVGDAAETVARPVPIGALVDQPDSVIRIFQKATRVAPDERHETCRALALDVREALDSLGAGLEVDDLQADLATEIMEERRKDRSDLWSRSRAPELEEEGDAPLEVEEEAEPAEGGPLEDEEAPAESEPNQEEAALAREPDPETLAADEEDTADEVSPFDGRPLHRKGDTSALATEIPHSDREFQPEDPETPAPERAARERAASPPAPTREEGVSPAVLLGGIAAVLVIAAVLWFLAAG